jgi:hypothetical protein
VAKHMGMDGEFEASGLAILVVVVGGQVSITERLM